MVPKLSARSGEGLVNGLAGRVCACVCWLEGVCVWYTDCWCPAYLFFYGGTSVTIVPGYLTVSSNSHILKSGLLTILLSSS